jgi:hypothetical protein
MDESLVVAEEMERTGEKTREEKDVTKVLQQRGGILHR